MDKDKVYLQDWVFHYNAIAQGWAAIPRELYNQYWSNYNLEGIIRSSKIETLLQILHKTKGDPIEIEKFKNGVQ
jgi:hypothetical protein